MGHKVNPKNLRIGINTDWVSRWYNGSDFAKTLREDIQIRDFIKKNWKNCSIAEVEIERSKNFVRIIISTSRPGVIIGRGGSGIEEMTKKIQRNFFKNQKNEVKIDIQEVRNFEENASLLAQNIAEQLEKRMPFRKVMKTTLDQANKNKNVHGVKVEISGRLGGAEMSRKEWLSKGTIPLHTLRANIDYSRAIAYTGYGTIGIKVWVYKGE